ncbi:MAG: glycogen synthase GlgA [Gammaproteobacteria bacterium]|jgi:starch synthase|nr:glycogen synthase GlgA [Gammaproteobacteria bacterium]
MYIVMATPECAPVAKAGGLGDFVHGLSRELASHGHQVDIILPKYDCLRYDRVQDMETYHSDLWVPFYDRAVHCDVERGEVDGLQCFFVDAHSEHGFFNRGAIYGDADDPDRFTFFSHAILSFLLAAGKRPDIIHCNEWQTGLVPVLLFERYAAMGLDHTRVCYSLHNLGHQGWTTPHVLHMNGLDAGRLMVPDRLQDPGNPGAVNLMKGGIVFSNFVTTVSPRYAWEIQHTEQGMGLQGVLRTHDRKFGGVLNGIDTGTWNPATDAFIPVPYDADHLADKGANKTALRNRLGLVDAAKPIVAVISRLDRQKGIELIRHGIDFSLEQGAQFVLLGSAQDPAVNAQFWEAKKVLQESTDAHLELGYDEELSHLIYAGADMILIPSVYEPCGLTQMIAMRYGCVPIVRRVGGLADTVFDANYNDRPFEERNGYVFDELSFDGLESAMKRAIGLWWEYPDYFRQLRLNGMRMDNSWARPAQDYLSIYEHIRVR